MDCSTLTWDYPRERECEGHLSLSRILNPLLKALMNKEEEPSSLGLVEALGGCAMIAFAASALVVTVSAIATAHYAAYVGLKFKNLLTGK